MPSDCAQDIHTHIHPYVPRYIHISAYINKCVCLCVWINISTLMTAAHTRLQESRSEADNLRKTLDEACSGRESGETERWQLSKRVTQLERELGKLEEVLKQCIEERNGFESRVRHRLLVFCMWRTGCCAHAHMRKTNLGDNMYP